MSELRRRQSAGECTGGMDRFDVLLAILTVLCGVVLAGAN